MKTKISIVVLLLAFTTLLFSGCNDEGPAGQNGMDGLDGLDAEVYYSEWFSPTAWSGESGDWYFDASAPDLTEAVVEQGLVLAYVWLAGDLYEGAAVRPLPAYALDANWSFLIMDYGSIEFTSDMFDQPLTEENKFRFIAIPGNIPALKSGSIKSVQELRNMNYQEVCKLLGIPE